jgi:hypothetical protein
VTHTVYVNVYCIPTHALLSGVTLILKLLRHVDVSADRPYVEVYDSYSASSEYFGYPSYLVPHILIIQSVYKVLFSVSVLFPFYRIIFLLTCV